MKRRAISSLLTVLILVGVTVTGGLLVYGTTSGWFGSIFGRGEISVVSIDFIKATSGKAAFMMTLKNTGNMPVADDDLALNITRPGGYSGGGEQHPSNAPLLGFELFPIVYAEETGTGHVKVGGVKGGPYVYNVVGAAGLQPGHDIAITLTSPTDINTDDYIVGNNYYVTVTARFSDGSLFTTTVSVIYRQG